MPSGGAFGSHLGRGEADGGLLEDDEELQRLERHLEGSMEGVEVAGSNFLTKARQGLASLKRSLSGGAQEEGDDKEGGDGGANMPIGRKGYGADSSSELEQGMNSKMEEEAAKLLLETSTRLKDEAPHLHAPELFHPEAVMSYEELRGEKEWADDSNKTFVDKLAEAMKFETGSSLEKEGHRRNNSLANDAEVGGEGGVDVMEGEGEDERTEEEKEEVEDEMLDMLQMFTPE